MPPAVREAFRTLAVQLEELSSPGSHSVMVASGSTGDGKTTSAINLAVTLAASGKSVALLDFDLRKPNVGRILGLPQGHTLESLATNRPPLRDLLTPVPSVTGLSVLAIAPLETNTHLVEYAMQQMLDLLQEARDVADYIVIDTAPLGEVSDALRAIHHVDRLVLVARPGNTRKADLEGARDLLERLNQRPVGVVLVGVATPQVGSYYSYGVGRSELVAPSR